MSISRISKLSLSQDPILTELARMFEQSDFVSNLLLPEVAVTKMTGKFPVFGKEHMRVHDTVRGLKSKIKEMPVDDWTTDSYSLNPYGLKASMDYLEAEAAADIVNLETYYLNAILSSIALQKEQKAVELMTTEANYSADHYTSLTTNEYFNDADSDPIAMLRDAMETVRSKINRKPNVVVFGQSSFNGLQSHPKLLDVIKYSQTAIVTEELIAALLSTADNKVTVKVGSGMYEDPATKEMEDLWGDVTVMAYNKKLPSGQKMTQYDNSFGKIFTQKGYPWVSRWSEEGGVIDYIAALTMYDTKITQKDAGFCIVNCIG
jgi:hypothetical protein